MCPWQPPPVARPPGLDALWHRRWRTVLRCSHVVNLCNMFCWVYCTRWETVGLLNASFAVHDDLTEHQRIIWGPDPNGIWLGASHKLILVLHTHLRSPKFIAQKYEKCSRQNARSEVLTAISGTTLMDHDKQWQVTGKFILFKHRRQRVEATYMLVKSVPWTYMHDKWQVSDKSSETLPTSLRRNRACKQRYAFFILATFLTFLTLRNCFGRFFIINPLIEHIQTHTTV